MTMTILYSSDNMVYEIYVEESRENYYRFMEGFAEVIHETNLPIDSDEFLQALQKKLRWIIDVVRPYDYEFSYNSIELMIDEMEDREIEEGNGD